MTLAAQEFIRRFLLHVLPNGFMRIRHFGFLANRSKKQTLSRCRQLLGVPVPPANPAARSALELMRELTGVDFSRCPPLPPRNSGRDPNPAGRRSQSPCSENGFVMTRCPHRLPPRLRSPQPARRRPGRGVPSTRSTDSLRVLIHGAAAPSNAPIAPGLPRRFPDHRLQDSTPCLSRLQSP
jgi:Putative transposase